MKNPFILLLFTALLACSSSNVQEAEPQASVYDTELTDIRGEKFTLEQYKGKKILLVNVASECGFTPQYESLQKLYEKYQEKLVVIGLPSNEFGGQEPGTEEEIAAFCKQNYGVTFPLTEKIEVKGENQHPLYAWLTQKEKNGFKDSSVKWNFQKYLLDEEGRLVDYYYSTTDPLSEKIVQHLE